MKVKKTCVNFPSKHCISDAYTLTFWPSSILICVNIFSSENYLRSGRKTITQTISFDSSSETESSGIYRNSKLLQQFSTTSSDGCESDISTPRPVRPKQRPIPKYVS